MVASPLTIERDPHGVATLILRALPEGSSGGVVVLNRALLQAIDHALDQLKAEPARGFVLASSSRVFIAGADLKEIMGLSDPELHEYLRFGQRVYSRIAALPCTTVAAIHGAVLGGGLEIAMHCDHLIGGTPSAPSPDKPAKPYLVGLPEAGLGICPGWGGTNMLPARMDPVRAIRMTATGQTFTSSDAAEVGVFEQMVPAESLLERARALASRPKHLARSRPPCIADADRCEAVRAALAHVRPELPVTPASQAVIDCVQIGLDKGWDAALDAEREHLVRLRGSAEGRAAIEAFFAKTKQ